MRRRACDTPRALTLNPSLRYPPANGGKTKLNFLWGFLGGIIAWFATEFVGQPIKTFLAARSEAAKVLAQYEDLDRYDPERDPPDPELTNGRAGSLRAVGAALIAFAHSNQFLLPVFRRLHLSPQHAGSSLILLSQMKPNGVSNADERDEIMRYLRLGRKFGEHHRD
jgi:hypothetical protein